MDVKVLGTGCAKCTKLLDEVKKAVAAAGVAADVSKVERLDEIMAFGVMMTPALVIDGVVKVSGRVPSPAELAGWLQAAAAKG